MALVASWGALCLHSALTETYFPSKEGTSVTHRVFTGSTLGYLVPLLVQAYLCCIPCLLLC